MVSSGFQGLTLSHKRAAYLGCYIFIETLWPTFTYLYGAAGRRRLVYGETLGHVKIRVKFIFDNGAVPIFEQIREILNEATSIKLTKDSS